MSLRFLTTGESHGPALLAILEGLPAGLPVDLDFVNRELSRRQKGYGAGPRMKLERDVARVLGGVMAGLTTGAPLGIQIDNLNHDRWQGQPIPPFTVPRPGHVDLAAAVKYGFRDLRPGLERASARETAARVAVGALCKLFLAEFGITVGGYVRAIGDVEANPDQLPYPQRFANAEANDVRCPDPVTTGAMQEAIRGIIANKDTLGGVLEIVAFGLPVGLGSHVQWDRRLEARLGAAILSVQAMKGVEIGPAFANTRLPGTQAQDGMRLDDDGLILRTSNRSGGLEGGITTGQPLVIRAAMKPIATTLTPQQTVDLRSGQETPSQYERSDFCPVPRSVPILEAMVAYVLADALLEKLGGDSLEEMRPRFVALRQPRLGDLPMDEGPHVYWP
jgi:chorismate synthase